jgi:hypothetical protein
VHPIRAVFVLLAMMFVWSPAVPAVSAAAAQQRTLDLARDRSLHDAVADAQRLGIVIEVRQLEPGTLQLTTGPEFSRASSTSYNLSRIYLAYATYQRGHTGPIVLEFRHDGEKIGEYRKDGLKLTRQPPSPPPAPMAASAAAAAPRRTGWYATLGGGGGSADFTCERCRFERSPAVSGYLMLGRRISERTVLGVEATGWSKSDETSRGRLHTVTAVALARFGDNLPLFLSGGLGYARYRRRLPAGTAGADALGYSARLGVEVFAFRQFRIMPYVGLAGSFGQPEFTYEDGSPYGLSANFSNLQFGAALVLD